MPEVSTRFSSRLFYRKAGHGPAIVLLHGFPESGDLWRNIYDQLARKFTVIVPDFPGVGQSPLDHATSINDMADCVQAILEQEDIAKAVIAGHSMGGYVALAYGRRYANRVAGLSMVHSTPEADDEEKKTTRQKVIDLVRRGVKNAFMGEMVPKLFAPSFRRDQEDIVKKQVLKGVEMPAEAVVNFYKAMMDRDSSVSELRNMQFPVQWILGEDDDIIPLQKILPHTYASRVNFVSVYSGCGHMSMIENPAQLTKDLKEFADYSYTNKGR